jgi:hypothetical protein
MPSRGALLVLAPIVLILGLATAFSQRWEDDKPRIGLAVANLQADFFNQIKQSVTREAARQGVEVLVADARGDAATQVNQIEDFVTKQVDAIIYIPAGATAAGVPVRDAREADIPIVAVDRNPPDAPADTFIASDSVASAKELAKDRITVNAYCPGIVGSDMWSYNDREWGRLLGDYEPGELMAEWIAGIPLGRAGTNDDVAALLLFLASDEAAYITGQTINVDGGMFMS